MSIYRKAVNNPVTTSLVFIAMAIFGIFSLINISLDRFPKFDANVVMVMSSYPGASAEDIETNLTKVLENSLNGVSDLKDMTSTSKENISLITLEFMKVWISMWLQTMSVTSSTWSTQCFLTERHFL